MDMPNKYDAASIEEKWQRYWEEQRLYAWDSSRPREETFVVDTPPPTVSGSLHVGHMFSYSHQDFIVRYQRMKGKNIFFPIGWDDNGLAAAETEGVQQLRIHLSLGRRPGFLLGHQRLNLLPNRGTERFRRRPRHAEQAGQHTQHTNQRGNPMAAPRFLWGEDTHIRLL